MQHAAFEVLILFAIAVVFNAISAAVKKSRGNQSGDWDEIEVDEPGSSAPSNPASAPSEGGMVEIPGFPGLTLRLEPAKQKPKPRPKAAPPAPQKAPPPVPAAGTAIHNQARMRVSRRSRGGNRNWDQKTVRRALVAREILNRPRCYDM
jgi:hypothetical protein